MWCIQATVNGQQVPTFYLDENVQGITGFQHAFQIAKSILEASMTDEDTDIYIGAIKL